MAKSNPEAIRDEEREVETEAGTASGGDHGYNHEMGDIETTKDNSDSIAQTAANDAKGGDSDGIVEVD